MRPRLSEPQLFSIGGDRNAVRVGQVAEQHLGVVERRTAGDEPSVAALLHQVMTPLAGLPSGAAFDDEDAAIRG